jgi:NhaP-type Na+/H+ or K+/H+ antiporter
MFSSNSGVEIAIGIMILVGLFGGLLAKKFKFPMVTGYIIVGVILSPSVLHILSEATIDNMEIITSVALGIIAYEIGGSLPIRSIRTLGRSVIWVTIAETFGALLAVTLALTFTGHTIIGNNQGTLLHSYLPIAIIIGAAVAPAAPAVTMAVIRELRARGTLTNTLLAVVALDDALGVVLFAICLRIAVFFMTGIGGFEPQAVLGTSFLEIIKSMGLGAGLGLILNLATRRVGRKSLLLVVTLAIIIICVGLCQTLGLSLILANMLIGFVVRNTYKEEVPFTVIEEIEPIVFVVFFVIAGMHFNVAVMQAAGIVAAIIFGTRFLGKYLGIRGSRRFSKAPAVVTKYLPFALMPEAGVTIGLALVAKNTLPASGLVDVMFNAILASVIINELAAPPLTRFAIIKAGEANVVTK